MNIQPIRKLISKNWILLGIFFVIFIIIVTRIYPITVRKHCLEKSEEKIRSSSLSLLDAVNFAMGKVNNNDYSSSEQTRLNNYYRACLVANGLEPESIFVNIQ